MSLAYLTLNRTNGYYADVNNTLSQPNFEIMTLQGEKKLG
jgi:hypothetical protein